MMRKFAWKPRLATIRKAIWQPPGLPHPPVVPLLSATLDPARPRCAGGCLPRLIRGPGPDHPSRTSGATPFPNSATRPKPTAPNPKPTPHHHPQNGRPKRTETTPSWPPGPPGARQRSHRDGANSFLPPPPNWAASSMPHLVTTKFQMPRPKSGWTTPPG